MDSLRQKCGKTSQAEVAREEARQSWAAQHAMPGLWEHSQRRRLGCAHSHSRWAHSRAATRDRSHAAHLAARTSHCALCSVQCKVCARKANSANGATSAREMRAATDCGRQLTAAQCSTEATRRPPSGPQAPVHAPRATLNSEESAPGRLLSTGRSE